MGWTSYHASFYKNGKIDRKAECDSIMNCDMVGNKGRYEVLKSAMVGSTYYAAVKKTIFKTGAKPEKESVFGVVMLTSVNNKDHFNFSYKDMDESAGPGYYDCPKGILDVLTPTEYEWAKEWRERCYENIKKKKSPDALSNLPKRKNLTSQGGPNGERRISMTCAQKEERCRSCYYYNESSNWCWPCDECAGAIATLVKPTKDYFKKSKVG